MVINPDHDDFHRIAHLAHVPDLVHVTVIKFADVYQPIPARNQFDKRTKVGDRSDLALINSANLNHFGHRLDPVSALFDQGLVLAADRHRSVIDNVDVGLGFFLQRPNRLAARPDHRANLLLVDRQLDHARSVRAQILVRPLKRVEHVPKNRDASLSRSRQSLANDLFTDSRDLQIELNTGDPKL
jgi:hypothetical protein